ncbi:MFS transporter, partial [Pseudactinotalea suaedae]
MAQSRRNLAALVASNLLGGVGVASGVAVGALLAERLGGTAIAGLAQAASVLGAAVAAVPLATMAAKAGRRRALTLGYVLAVAGAVLIITAGIVGQLIVLLVGLGLFGVAQACNLQSRYAAADDVPADRRARTMSIVIWATTIGSVAGPNLTAPGDRLGVSLGLPELVGPYLFSVVSFAAAATVIGLLFRPTRAAGGVAAAAAAAAPPRAAQPVGPEPTAPAPAPVPSGAEKVGALAALRWAAGNPRARFAVVLIASAHAVMVMVMVMTPLHMQHHGMTLELIGIVISLHVLGMYALSPVWGWAADRFGTVRTALAGMAVEGTAVVLGYIAAFGDSELTMVALTVLGLGWSGCVIAGSALLTAAAPERVRVPLQGATDAGMNYAGAGAA